jgi:hypothetical protein
MTEDQDFPVPPCFDDPATAADRLTDMFVRMAQARRIETGQVPAERAVFRKVHGVAHGRFERLESVPRAWRVGLLAHEGLDAWVRFSSDASPTTPDLGTTLGVGVKLFGVTGLNALGEEGDTADLVLQNHDVFFVDDAQEMVEFTYAGVVQQDYPGYLATHPETRRILDDMTEPESSVLTASYWGVLPFTLGGEIVRYRLHPETPPVNIPDDDPDYLHTDLARRLREREHALVLSVQVRTDPDAMPLDRATVAWPEEDSPYVPVARLVLARQDVDTRGQCDYGQSLSFNIWRVPTENAPVAESSIAAVRKQVYAAGAALRHTANGQPMTEPTVPRSAQVPTPDVDDCIVQAVIHPAIGVARVGNSPDEFVIGPEVVDPDPLPPGSYRDAEGRLKRQAARFRIFGVNALGTIVRELLPEQDDVELTWHVELANTKSSWYGFQLALDIPEASSAPATTLRNPTVSDRSSLEIRPGSRSVSGRSEGPVPLDGGAFMGTPVDLGDLRTDEAGRLIVLGGSGCSASYDGRRAITFANNEGWHDDVSDGPVTATVMLGGLALEVIPAWVVVAPPNYAPQRTSVRTMWDLMRDVAIQAGTLARPVRPSFRDDILPIFQRLAGLQWVNAGFAAGFGFDGALDLTSSAALARLASPLPAHREVRRTVARSFRDFDVDGMSPKPWPWLYGDAMNIPPVPSPRQNAALTPTQMWMLEQWAEGCFDADLDLDRLEGREGVGGADAAGGAGAGARPRRGPRVVDELPVEEQGDMLTRAALEFCLADAFHPGCEMTWPVRAATMYLSPFRFAHAATGWEPPTLGAVLTSDSVTIPNGPHCAREPGSITRWMAVPWQTDTASCRSGYSTAYDPYVPTFWPARVPNQVLTRENYDVVVDESRSPEERAAAFANRAAWIEPLGAVSYTSQINNMVRGFDHLGVVEVLPGPSDGAFPALIEVEDEHRLIPAEAGDEAAAIEARLGATSGAAGGAPVLSSLGASHRVGRSAADVDVSGIEKVRRFPGGLRT